ncbi:transcriptional regulator, tetR family [Vibrio ishigakensis]|uniref:Transcriptional regulator, tetR family n=1 Tax=Vibrio ishigakensis TaxID=1481914 RepID=A0A0B8P7X7_9VIBR|nr:transcriptional regulator, tetR family [Vibrio ishigakensis]
MAQRKQGRRTAEEAERTKLEILASAAFLFCEKGYNQVSIRDISEQAGVTHSLIRHYFGAKVQIWRAIIDEIHEFVDAYCAKLEDHIDTELPDNERLYRYLCHFMAYMLKKPQLCQIMLDYIHHPENEAQEGEEFSPHIQELVTKAYSDMPRIVTALAVNPGQIMWRFLIHSGGAVAFKPS